MTVKLIMALVVGFLVSSGVGAFLVPWLVSIKVGQPIKKIGPTWHKNKEGTPTMGGIMFIVAVAVVCLSVGFSAIREGELAHIYVLVLALVFGAIGFLDDYEKLRHHENTGLSAKAKFILQLTAAIAFLLLLRLKGYLSPNLYIPFWNTYVPISEPLYFVFAAFVVVGTVNAVNITDGVDGLAAGTCIPVFLCFTAIVFCWGKDFFAQGVYAAGLTGALLGFLVYNFHPARVFMGDTGSLFLGGSIAGMAFALDIPLLLIPLCIMPIIETLSDIIQVGYFKLTHGKRIFKMAPFHHHLEMGGWTGRKWKEKEIFVLFASVTLVMAVISLLGVTGRYSF
ncbi:MAG: phospho-N-acetylmuramoyl-pentapeptide-transferase [Oscillospiraceae bacterium]|nr:phospho-N-acetylmuramoyl-pentapeptide-transferase [Oscillospiraceae bacterium]